MESTMIPNVSKYSLNGRRKLALRMVLLVKIHFFINAAKLSKANFFISGIILDNIINADSKMTSNVSSNCIHATAYLSIKPQLSPTPKQCKR